MDTNDGEDCSEDIKQMSELRGFSKAVDESLASQLKATRKARLVFERRACDFRYAETMHKSPMLAEAYGPNGLRVPGGSYLYELRHWADELGRLHRSCRNHVGCSTLIDHLREHPVDDLSTGGGHGKAGSKVYDEFRMACSVGKTRAPVPNDSPVWCDVSTGLCERRSCRNWWREAHPDIANPPPWVDDREDYGYLEDACGWIHGPRSSNKELNTFQSELVDEAEGLKQEFCSPRWVDGYCSEKHAGKRHAECTIPTTGWRCRNGLILPKDDISDDAPNWKEAFPEKPVHVTCDPVLLSPPPAPRRRGRPHSAKRRVMRSFL